MKSFFFEFLFCTIRASVKAYCSVCNVKKIELYMDCHSIEWICSKSIFLFRESSLKNNTHRNCNCTIYKFTWCQYWCRVIHIMRKREMDDRVAFLAGFFKLYIIRCLSCWSCSEIWNGGWMEWILLSFRNVCYCNYVRAAFDSLFSLFTTVFEIGNSEF